MLRGSLSLVRGFMHMWEFIFDEMTSNLTRSTLTEPLFCVSGPHHLDSLRSQEGNKLGDNGNFSSAIYHKSHWFSSNFGDDCGLPGS